MLLSAMSGDGSLSSESILGDACADALRLGTGADFAIVPGGEFSGNLEPKNQTHAAIRAVLNHPDASIALATLTPAQLCEMLEAGLSAITLAEDTSIDRGASAFDGFPQVSGFRFTYDASARPGERVMHLYGGDGKEIDRYDTTRSYTVAAPAYLFQGKFGYPLLSCTEIGRTLSGLLSDYVAAGTGDAYTGQGRITAVGCADYNIINHFPLVTCVIAAMVIWVGARLWKFKHPECGTRKSNYPR